MQALHSYAYWPIIVRRAGQERDSYLFTKGCHGSGPGRFYMHAGRPSHNPTAAKLVERQMRNWELARAQRLSVPAPQREEVEDFIAISRNAGAQGKVVAAELGEKLGWPVFGREILDVMAGDDDLRRQIYASMDERDLSWYEETLRALMQPEFVKNDYFCCSIDKCTNSGGRINLCTCTFCDKLNAFRD